MTIETLKQNKSILLECISGSRAYGLEHANSDTDIKGVFLLPKKEFYGFEQVDQVNNATNDEVYFELKKFMDLLAKNNPNILELLHTPADCILYKHPIMDHIKQDLFLSKLCHQTFAGYAQSQIKKAKGLNKKIVNPVDEIRKSILDFCYIIQGQQALKLLDWLEIQGYDQTDCGLVKVPHMREVYALFHKSQFNNAKLSGICQGMESNDVSLSSIEKGYLPVAVMSFNKDGYSAYCKDYKAYWEWVQNRNEDRFQNTMEHQKNYDAKNMMHTFRLLNMAEEIAKEKQIHVRRTDREFLWDIRMGKFDYDDLVKMATDKIGHIDELFDRSDLPEKPDQKLVEELLIEMRDSLYFKSC